MKVGFTGTQRGMTEAQKATFATLVTFTRMSEFHHGCCVGCDAEAVSHVLAKLKTAKIICHTPTNVSKRAWTAWTASHVTLEAKDYLVRNHDIVDACDIMIATPAGDKEELRSGTWATIRYARKLSKPICLILPSGEMKTEHGFASRLGTEA